MRYIVEGRLTVCFALIVVLNAASVLAQEGQIAYASTDQTNEGGANMTPEKSICLEADTLARFETLLDNLREELKIPAISAAIVKDQETAWAKGFGYADLENQMKATEHTPYHLASLTKTFASTIIMQLVKDSKIDLNDPITRYGIELESEGIIRVKHLLTHTSEGVPGQQYSYSGSRFGFLTQIVEKASGRPFTELLIENILEPLEMSETAPNVAVMEQTKPLPVATEVEQEVIAAAKDLLSAYGRGDADTIMQYLPPENTNFDSNGNLLGRFTDERSLRMAFAAGYRIDFDVRRLSAKVYGEAAITIGYILGRIMEPGGAKREVRWRSSMFWIKREGKWYVIHSHESLLKATLISISDENRQRFQEVHRKLAKPYALDESHNITTSEYPPNFGVSAGLIASVMDMAKYDIAIDRNVFLDKETQDYVFTPTVSTEGETLPYGLGWFVQDYKGTKLVWHYGYWVGNSSLILKVPKHNMSFIVFANTDNLSRPFHLGDGDVMNSIMALAFLKAFVFPKEYQEALPEINWKAGESELKDQLKHIEEKDYKEIYVKELVANARMLSSVGEKEAADRLYRVHRQLFE
jgi:CubicO group peptidase (beta-lactamase class C family)